MASKQDLTWEGNPNQTLSFVAGRWQGSLALAAVTCTTIRHAIRATLKWTPVNAMTKVGNEISVWKSKFLGFAKKKVHSHLKSQISPK